MAKTFLHTPSTSATADQDWVNDVNAVAKDELHWDGSMLSPDVKNVVFDNQPSRGIMVDHSNPSSPWADLLGNISVDENEAANRPTYTIYRGVIKQYRFDVNDRIYINFHIPHDYLPGSDLYVHAHWSSIGTTAGEATWQFDASYASGHNTATFHDPITTSVVEAFNTQYKHMIAETQLSAVGGAGGLLDTSLIEVDGVIMMRVELHTTTMATSPYLHFVDIHYKSTGIGTKNKTPNFYT